MLRKGIKFYKKGVFLQSNFECRPHSKRINSIEKFKSLTF